MRITNGMMVTNMIRNLNSNLNRLDGLQQQSASGKVIQYASDNPVAATRILKMKSYLSEVEQHQKNADDAKSWMDYSESVLKQVQEDVTRMRELTVEASNGSYSDDDRQAILCEITQLKKSIIETGNLSYSGRYILSGYDTNEAPLEDVTTSIGDKVTYKGKYLSLGGPVSASVSDDDFKAFYISNMDKISGQPELISANYQDFTAASPELDFEVVLDGVSQTISLTDGVNYDIDTLQAQLQSEISSAFPAASGQPDPLIKVSTENGKLKLTVQDGTSLQLKSGTLDIGKFGFSDDVKSTLDQKQEIEYKVGTGNYVRTNVEASEVFGRGQGNLFDTLSKLELALNGETSYKTATYEEGPPADVNIKTNDLDLSSILDDLDTDLNRSLKARADLGARTNYVELTQNRLESNYTTFTELLSNTEDADYAEVSMKLSSAETIFQAALSAGAKVIQNSLLDFIK